MILTNGILELYCGFLAVMMLLGTGPNRKRQSKATLFNRIMLVMATVMLLSIGFAHCFVLNLEKWQPLYMLLIASSCSAFYALICIYTRYVMEVLSIENRRLARTVYIFNIVSCTVGMLMWCSNSFFPYFFDYRTMQVTDPLMYRIAAIPGGLPIIADLILIALHAKHIDRRDAVLLMVMPSMPLVSSAIGQIIPGLSLQHPLILAGLILNHLYFDEKIERELRQRERELEEKRLQMTLERVKPHYIYNVLTSIYYLCEMDPKKAQEAVGIFSDYLRAALRSMEKAERVPFSWELQLIENYLKLEQMRFSSRLSVTYDIAEETFLIPPFTVQPLVENAVKHGMRENTGIHIRITCARADAGYRVEIHDDGIGFDWAEESQDSPSGLRNIRALLALHHSGELSVESKHGVGTSAVILFRS